MSSLGLPDISGVQRCPSFLCFETSLTVHPFPKFLGSQTALETQVLLQAQDYEWWEEEGPGTWRDGEVEGENAHWATLPSIPSPAPRVCPDPP